MRLRGYVLGSFVIAGLTLQAFGEEPSLIAEKELALPERLQMACDHMEAPAPQKAQCCAEASDHHCKAHDEHGHEMQPVELSFDETYPMTRDASREFMLLEMRRQGSGTAWQPVDNPMMMNMHFSEDWLTMGHWSAFLDYDYQGGDRGSDEVVSQNWLMASAARPVGERGIVQFRGMMSAEPFTVGKEGYPLLFQTGETFEGRPLVDRQHPHDLFMELSAQYLHHLRPETWLRFYLAPVGEPALGPVAYPHRYSTFLNPEAPLSHHIQDSTHISFGVLTAGIVHNKWQIEGSLFNGKEPDENRYDFDFGPLTSYSGRISYMPNANWSLQASHGHLDDPEILEPGDLDRTTASVQYSKTFNQGWWANTLAYGHNFESGTDENGVILESTLNFKNRNYVFGNIENVQKRGLREEAFPGRTFNITKLTLGVARDLTWFNGVPVTLGAMIAAHIRPAHLASAYGEIPISFHVFLHTNAPRHQMAMHQHP